MSEICLAWLGENNCQKPEAAGVLLPNNQAKVRINSSKIIKFKAVKQNIHPYELSIMIIQYDAI